MRRILPILLIGLLISSCGVSVFEVFSPKSANDSDNPETLVELGNKKLREKDYEAAFDAFDKALKLDPDNSLALEGICIAYMGKKLSYGDLIQRLTSQEPANLYTMLQDLYDVSSFTYNHLGKIIDGKADGKISSTDPDVNFSFFLFSLLYGVFRFVDTDGDYRITNDSDDLFLIKNDMSITPPYDKMKNISTDFFFTIRTIKNIFDRIDDFNIVFAKTLKSQSNYYNSLETEDVKNLFMEISSNMLTIKSSLDEALNNIGVDTNTYRFSFLKMLNVNEITNIVVDLADDVILIFLSNSGVTNYDIFTNSVDECGFTDESGNASVNSFVSGITNLFPDLSPATTNIITTLTNYYGHN